MDDKDWYEKRIPKDETNDPTTGIPSIEELQEIAKRKHPPPEYFLDEHDEDYLDLFGDDRPY